ncbi:MAG: chemotaxis protein CheR [Gammaproteobacteria bacterium]|nr:chemotaxis protein CheR [Gammaproteobacteria bacterium]
MKDIDCVGFLQWALPALRMRWLGFRKVRGQVCKRIQRRIDRLELADVEAYRSFLQRHPKEWRVLDGLCRVTVSRFYRDQRVFASLERDVLPSLARKAICHGQSKLRAWSAGCGAGEEPYTLSLLWKLRLQSQAPSLGMDILATDVDDNMIARAKRACYDFGSLKELPESLRTQAFVDRDGTHCLRAECKANVDFLCEDVRTTVPSGPFDLILCRNLVFTYFGEPLQLEITDRISHSLNADGVLVLGVHEKLPTTCRAFKRWSEVGSFYRKSGRMSR